MLKVPKFFTARTFFLKALHSTFMHMPSNVNPWQTFRQSGAVSANF
jgi:hypothetical protein